MNSRVKNILVLVSFIAVSQLAGLIGAIFTASSIPTWYADLIKPDLAPPNWVFGPVWTTLFVLMGVAAWLVWREGWSKREVKVALGWFGCQLALNTLWSIIFFGLQSPGMALIEIGCLWLAIAVTIRSFYRVSVGAAWLLVPYLAWVSFAAYLNYMIWMLN